MFGLLKVSGILRAVSPIFHGGNEKTGSVVMLNRLRYIVDGEPEDVPYISGNAVRGIWRRMIFSDLLNQLDYSINVSKPSGQRLYHALFTGGVLETVDEKSSGVIDIQLKRKILNLLIPARLFGFSIGNQMIEGKLKVGHVLPVCKELMEYIPVEPKLSFYDMLSTTFQTRKDELRAEREEGEQAVQMLVEYEVFVPGSQFYHEVKLEDPTDLDISCLARVIELWKMKPFIGGKSSVGMGELDINYDLDAKSDDYMKFIEKKRDEICSLLDELESI